MITEINVDGVYRPEKGFDGQWRAVAYVHFRGKVNMVVHSETMRGRTYHAQYGQRYEAEAVCNQLNNVQCPRFPEWVGSRQQVIAGMATEA